MFIRNFTVKLAVLFAGLSFACGHAHAESSAEEKIRDEISGVIAINKPQAKRCLHCETNGNEADEKAPRLFDSAAPLKLAMMGPFQKMAKDNPGHEVNKELHYPGTISSAKENIQVNYRARGHYRRYDCDEAPPFLVEVKGKKSQLFRDVSKELKFATHCRTGADLQEAVFAEYTVYKILEASGLPGFRVRLAETKYKDSDTGAETSGTGFFIESIKDYAKRMGYGPQSEPEVSLDQMKARFKLTQAFLRNADAEIDFNANPKTDHNVKRVVNAKGETLDAVSYDFDLSSLVGKSDRLGANWDQDGYNKRAIKDLKKLPGMQAEFKSLLEHREAILKAIDDGPMSEEHKGLMKPSVEGFLDELAKNI
jgi:hypothetical protein